MIAQPETKRYTIDEYLELEIASETRNEYCDGEIIPMTGGTPEHNEIASILNAALRVSLKGKPYSIFVADQRLWIPERKLYTYPDVMVVPRPLERQQGRTDTITNPVMIAEVLSKSTKSYDRDEKFSAYRTIPTFQEYLLIDQYTAHVEQYSKTDSHKWIFTEYDDPESYISLSSIPFEIRLADIYESVEFEP
ncbi:Uma2 family endonuclease [Nostoc spongiaeforme FACHB-130]|uniref:Uma2 family endonuclease n=1 Tax=Nostoc spongiaeforme FACHB-130 TaxID=1357510 RepID=A0ABR8G0W3_9NOSO|nr:Uma2 family endonuclease [Nostoc spongiaeforme]MBD2596848.1 Uma2 family endonuclease [Nostoc spongiaeforme FACHB-130]